MLWSKCNTPVWQQLDTVFYKEVMSGHTKDNLMSGFIWDEQGLPSTAWWAGGGVSSAAQLRELFPAMCFGRC